MGGASHSVVPSEGEFVNITVQMLKVGRMTNLGAGIDEALDYFQRVKAVDRKD